MQKKIKTLHNTVIHSDWLLSTEWMNNLNYMILLRDVERTKTEPDYKIIVKKPLQHLYFTTTTNQQHSKIIVLLSIQKRNVKTEDNLTNVHAKLAMVDP